MTSNLTRTTRVAGTLTLTVWPDTALGEHQRYAYRITDTTTEQTLEGRDLFTGAGQPVAPGEAIRDLAVFLTAAGEAHQYILDHPDPPLENGSLFPTWVAEAAHRNADALTNLTEPHELYGPDGPSRPGARSGPGPDGRDADVRPQRWVSVVFLQGAEADDALALIDRDGPDAAIEYLAGYDYGEETTDAALENGYVYDDLPTGTVDEVVVNGSYTLSYNHHLGHVHLLRDYDTPPDPALTDPTPIDPTLVAVDSATRPGAHAAVTDWFAGPSSTPQGPGRGLSL